MLNVRVKKALLTILTACLTVLMMVGAVLGFNPTPQTVKAADSPWMLVTDASTLAEGDQVVIVAKGYSYALSTEQRSNNRGAVEITKNSDDTVNINDNVQILTLEAGTKTDTFAFNTGSGYLYAASTSSNHLKTQDSVKDNGSFSITIDNGSATIKAQQSARNLLRFNNSNSPKIFSCYSSGQADVSIYKMETGAPACEHANKTTAYESLENGTHTVTVTCTDCSKTVSTDTVGCSYGAEQRVEPTETADGKIYKTCQYCEYENVIEVLPKLNLTKYTLSFSTPDVVAEVEPVEVAAGYTYELGSAENYNNYTFAGWAEATLDGVTTTAPTLYKAGEEYTMGAEDTTLYAVYTYSEGGSGNFEKVTEALSDWSGTYLIVCESKSVAFKGSLTSSTDLNSNKNSFSVEISNDSIEGTDEVIGIAVTINSVDGTNYTIKTASEYYIGKDNSSNGLNADKSTVYTNTISYSDGSFTIKSQGGTYLRYNASASMFRYYGSGQSAVTLYKLDPVTVYYTTNIGAAHVHSYTETPVEATCTTPGGILVTCDCGYSELTEPVAALGHDYQIASTTPGTCQVKEVINYDCSRCDATKTEEGEFGAHDYVDGVCSVCEFVDPLSVNYSGYYYFTFTREGEDFPMYVNNSWSSSRYTAYDNKPTSELSSYLFRVVQNEDGTYNIYAGTSDKLFANGEENVFIVKNGEYYNIYNADSNYFSMNKDAKYDYVKFYSGKGQIYDITFVEYKEIVSASLTLGAELVMEYKVAMDDKYAAAEMTFTMNGETTTVSGEKVGNVYVYSLAVMPQCMGANIAAELKLGDTVLASKADYSVKTYLEWLVNNGTAKEKQLATDLLLYGAAAQNYTGYDTENLVADLANLGAAPDATDFTLVTNEEAESYPVYFKSAGVNFSSDNKIFVRLSSYDENVTLTVNGVEVELNGDTYYYTEGLLATQFDDTFTFELYYDGVLMQTLTYSVNAYAYALKDSTNTAMANLAIALYNYGKSAEAYVA